MPYRNRFKIYLSIITIVSLTSQVWADETDKPEPMALRTIMQDMSKEMQTVTDAISREQWHKVATTAPLIGDHPQPPFMEKTRILRFIGSDASTFRAYDKKTQQAAQVLKKAAMAKDGEAVISAFAELQNNCLSCHQRFRESFVAHFYSKQ